MKKRILSALLAVMLLLAIAAPAIAAGTFTADAGMGGSGSITVNLPDGTTLDGRTINLYHLYTLDAGENKLYNSAVFGAFPQAANVGILEIDLNHDNTVTAEELLTYLELIKEDSLKVAMIANKMEDYVRRYNSNDYAGYDVSVTDPANSHATQVRFDGLPGGMYLIVDATPGAEGRLIGLVRIDGSGEFVINFKGMVPTIDKKVNGVEHVPAYGNQKVEYSITTQLPDMTGYTSYTFYIRDQIEPEVVINNDVEIKLYFVNEAGQTRALTLTRGVDYVVRDFQPTSPNYNEIIPASAEHMDILAVPQYFKFEFTDVIKWRNASYPGDPSYKAVAGSKIEVTYTATNGGPRPAQHDWFKTLVRLPNYADVFYSYNPNMPQYVHQGNTAMAILDTVVLDVTKYAGELNAPVLLAGVKFRVYRDTATMQPVADPVTGAVRDPYYPEIGFRAKAPDGVYYADIMAAPIELVTDANGQLNLAGLTPGTYWIEETEALPGYNKLTDPIKVEIITRYKAHTLFTSHIDAVDYYVNGTLAFSIPNGEPTHASNQRIHIKNNTGVEFPETGGIGTTIFIALGAVLVLGGLIVLTSRRRAGLDRE